MKTRTHHRGAFTLVEVLTVIAIIGLLVGLLVPAIGFALRRVKQNAIAMEVVTLADAVEKYKSKFGDYPPDGSSETIVRRHLRKLFPQIASSEFDVLDAAADCNQLPVNAPGRVMDPSEALVVFLGGYSDDPQHPLTGEGGPFAVTVDANGQFVSVEYRVDRNNPFYEFKQGQLTLDTSTGRTISTDEVLYNLPGQGPDVVPSYRLGSSDAPAVYFDSRTYSVGNYINHFSPGDLSPVTGHARPYRSTDVDTTKRKNPWTIAAGDEFYRYMNPKTFQVIHAGLDGQFGGLNPLQSGTQFHAFPSGQIIDIAMPPASQNGPSRYEDGDSPSAQLDNVANFSNGIFEDQLE